MPSVPSKLCSVVTVPLEVTWKTVPSPFRPARVGGSVEVSVSGLNQPCGGISAVRVVEAVQRMHSTSRAHSEDGTIAIGPAGIGCAIEVSIGGLHQRPSRAGAIAAIGKAVQQRCCAAWLTL